jgi:hypothetical protein
MKKLIALSALSLLVASAYASNHCPASQSCTYPIGTGSNDKTIYFTDLQPQHVYQCSFQVNPINALVEVKHTGLTAGVQVSPHGGSTHLFALYRVDTMGVPATQTVGNAVWFKFHAVGWLIRNKMILQCSIVK